MRSVKRSILLAAASLACGAAFATVPFHVTYLWHMHQPIYYPYESPGTIDANGRFNFSVQGVWDGDRVGAYTTWPKDAVQSAANKGIGHGGAQMSYSGSLAENNNNLWGFCTGATWDDAIDYARNTLRTTADNPRLDPVGIAYHHSLMPLTCKESMRMQIRLHKEQYKQLWDTTEYSKGFWPPECAFAEWMIPALAEEGLEWVIVDNGHLFRAVPDFPWSDASSCRVNPADMQNPSSTELGSTWVQLQNIWAPTKVLAPWSYQPHYIQYVNPYNAATQKIVAVPAGRYEGHENGRGGYGSFKPENVWGSHTDVNTDSDHPMLILCHSDGDNYGMKNSDAWHGQNDLFLDMCNNNNDFDFTSVQDYLEQWPPDPNEVIHVEPGSWIGIDGGTPYFEKWLSSTYVNGENPDRWSWSVLVAAQNRVILADSLENSYLGLSPNMDNVEWGIGDDTARAWHWYLNGETSCYWYWDLDRANPWDGNVTRACNRAVEEADKVINRHAGSDAKGPSMFPPQRDPYNPGGRMWNEASPASSDFDVWSYVYDVSGLSDVRLCYRTDNDGLNPLSSSENETYAGGPGVGSWSTVSMTNSWDPAVKGPDNIVPNPTCRAQKYTGRVTGQSQVLIDYFIEAVDTKGNTNRSDIFHVYVGQYNSSNVVPVTFSPSVPDSCAGSKLTITYNASGRSLSNASPVTLMIYYSTDTATNEYTMSGSAGGLWIYTSSIPSGATSAKVMFRSGATYDNNSGNGWTKSISACYIAPVVSFSPPAPNGCDAVKISYVPNSGVLSNASPVRIHVGYNGWQGVVSPDPVMTNNGGTWEYGYYPPGGCQIINACFNNGGAVWDNNNGANWSVNVTNCASTNQAVEFSPAMPRDCDAVTITFDATGTPLQGSNRVFVTATFDSWAHYAHYEMGYQGGKWVYYTGIPAGTLNLTVNFRGVSNTETYVYDNSGQNWSVAVSACSTTTLSGIRFAPGSPVIGVGGTPNNAGDNFDFNTNGGAATVRGDGGYGSFGEIYVNYDETNFYIGGLGVDLPRTSNDALIVFVAFNTLADNSWTLWNMNDQYPLGLDVLHNVAFNPPADIAILLGDVYGDGTSTNFNMYKTNGFQFGQGVFRLDSNTSNFWPMSNARLSQFDGAGTTACTSTWDSGSRHMTRWEGAIPWLSLDAAIGIDSITNCNLSGLIVSSGVSNGVDRYISGKYVGLLTTSGAKDEYGSFGYNFVSLNGLPVERPETYLYEVPVSWIRSTFGDGYTMTGTSDFDNDLVPDREEYFAGTDPRDYMSCLEVYCEPTGGEPGFVLRWSSVLGRKYTLYRGTNLITQAFSETSNNITATPPENVYTDTVSGADALFYHVKTGL